MSATSTSVSPAEFRGDLQRLLELAQGVLSAEARLEAFATQMRAEEKWAYLDGITHGLSHAVHESVEGAIRDVLNEHGSCDFYGPDKAQVTQDALDVFEFACERDRLDEWNETAS